jgi:excinuclease ABC subunit C
MKNVQEFLNSLPNKPGVYKMYNDQQQVLYVGKASNLKKRLASYFGTLTAAKTQALMAQVTRIETILTASEKDALLLENNLIKAEHPRYNILFKDDKSFPYLVLSRHELPALSVYRGPINKATGEYFGPFPNVSSLNFVLGLLQKIFKLRVCKDRELQGRSRPCMLYQIKLCSAPCVAYITPKDYKLQVDLVREFLHSKNEEIVVKLTALMNNAAQVRAYEEAARYRDQIAHIRKIQSNQTIVKIAGNYDVIVLVNKENQLAVGMLFVRGGLVIGNSTYFPAAEYLAWESDEILPRFIMHYYLRDKVRVTVPEKILVNVDLLERLSLMNIFQEKFGKKIVITSHSRGVGRELINMAQLNALNALTIKYRSQVTYRNSLAEFQAKIAPPVKLEHLECFDVSHTQGESQVASCVVFKKDRPSKKDYRIFNIKNITPGDDYAALTAALQRRYGDYRDLPDTIIIDGGYGQLKVAAQVLQQLGITQVFLLAVAKGRERKVGLEKIYTLESKAPLAIPPYSKALHFIQQLRDEAHRFALSRHRQKMITSRLQSELENIPGVGKEKCRMVLQYFGGITKLRSVGISDLAKVTGIGIHLATRIYDYLHG